MPGESHKFLINKENRYIRSTSVCHASTKIHIKEMTIYKGCKSKSYDFGKVMYLKIAFSEDVAF